MPLPNVNSLLLFGGTFDPPHVAHVVLPMLAREAVQADLVAYLPAALSPHKEGGLATPPRHRLAMLRLALAEAPWATILTDELDRFDPDTGRPSYTVDTLTTLRERLGPDVKLHLLLGTDQMIAFDRWRQPRRILELAEPVVMLRPPLQRETVLDALPESMQRDRDAWSQRMIDLPVMDLSATTIRQRLAQGQPITGMVHPQVEKYIAEHKLYR